MIPNSDKDVEAFFSLRQDLMFKVDGITSLVLGCHCQAPKVDLDSKEPT